MRSWSCSSIPSGSWNRSWSICPSAGNRPKDCAAFSRKLEHLDACKTKAEAFRHILAENERIQEELDALDLAQETMTSLSTSIRDSFGLYLNKTASELIEGITGGIYTSMSIDQNLDIYMNTPARLVPIEQVSSGTMDQIYLAVRLAAARLVQNGTDAMPLIFDDSFVMYDDERLKTALKWLNNAYNNQIIIFTCHHREAAQSDPAVVTAQPVSAL